MWRLSALAVAAMGGALVSGTVAAAPLWHLGGIPIAPSDRAETYSVVAPDAAGGAFIAWQDYRSGQSVIYAQHVTAEGAPAPGWPVGGLAVSSGYDVDPVIIADGRGGAFFAAANGSYVAVRHIAADGSIAPSLTVVSEVASVDAGSRADGGDGPNRVRPLAPTSAQKIEATGLAVLAPDGNGGALLAWEEGGHLRTGASVSRFTPTGSLVVGWGGPPPGSSDKYAPVICSDGADGAIAAWMAYGVGGIDIWAVRYASDGTLGAGWPSAGLVVCSASGDQDALGIVPDGAGGAIMVWQDPRNGTYEQVFAQRITATGTIAPGWPADGRPVSTLASNAGITRYAARRFAPARYSSVATDGAGGALIVWSLASSDGGDIYAQHVLSDGSLAPGWPSDGLPLCTATGAQVLPSIAEDGVGGAIVTWQDGRSAGGTAVYAQRVAGDGTLAPGWSADGVPVCAAPLEHLVPRAVTDGAGGALVAWQDMSCPSDAPTAQIFATHIAAEGALPTAPAVSVATATLVSSSAESGAVRLAWQTFGVTDLATTVYRQSVDGPWSPIASVPPAIDGSVTWADPGVIAGCQYRYGLAVSSCGAERILGQVTVDVPLGAGFDQLSISAQSASADSGRVQFAWRLTGGAGLPVAIFRRDSCSTWTLRSSTVADDSGQVTFEDRDLMEGHAESYRLRVHACGQDVDMPECWAHIPVGAGFIPTTASLIHQEMSPRGVYLTWKQLSGPSSAARVYRRDSTADWRLDAVLTVDPTGLIRYFDSTVERGGHYGYQLGLWNCGVEPRFAPTFVEISAGPPIPHDLALQAASPNPARQELTVLFTLPGTDPATLELFDIRGRRVVGRDVGSMGPGDHALVLADVSMLHPGVYLVRLSQGGRSRTMRAVLTR